MTHSHKTIKNQHLTAQNYTRQNHTQLPRYFAIIPMILLATVFILTACGGKKAAITVNINLPVDPVVPVDCAADPFDTRCTAKQAVERIDFCRTGDNLQNPLCSIAISTICTSSGQYANPFDTTICKGYQLTAELEFLNNCSDTDTAARNGAACDAVMDCINNPFAASCNTDVYAERRQLTLRFCNNAGNEDDPTCLGALTNCASANPNSNCGDLTNTYCTGAEGRTIAGDSSSCAARITAVCPTNPFAPVCTTDFVNSGFADANAVALAQQSFCQADNTNSNCTNLVKNFCDVATGDGIFDDLCDNVRERYNIARLESCIASDFAHSKCGVGFDRVRYDEINAICEDDGTDPTADICINFPNNFYSAYLICGDHTRTGTAPLTAFCQVDPSVFRTVRALCGSANTREVSDGVNTSTITTTLVGINPFHTICAEDVLNPDATADSRLEAQRNFCRQDVTNDLCPSTIATYCDALSGADLFDDLCDGDAYSADRIAHCDTAFVHDKCTATPDNIAQTLAICGTEASPGTNPFDPVCTEPTLTVNYSKTALDATRKRFCEGDLDNLLCEGTITLFCDYAKGDDIFDDLCNGADYTGARLAYCIDPALETHADCASASDNRATLSALCGTPTAPGTNPFSIACSRAVDISLLCAAEIAPKPAHCTDSAVLPESSAHTLLATQDAFCFIAGNANNENCADASVNFVASFDDQPTNILIGGTDDLSLGITETAIYNPDALPTAGVVINQGYKLGATDNGFALAAVNIASQTNPDNEAFVPFVRTRLYAGVLHLTDLGAPIIDNTANGFWNATLNAIIQRDVQKDIGGQIANIALITEVSDDFTLVVNFADGTIKSVASDPAAFEFTSENTVYDGTTGLTTQAMVSANLIIDGRFNPTGLIYGNTTLDYTGGSDSGGLTGLIGTDGAVAVFTSYDDYRNGNAYVGGFVATAGACLAGRTPFDKTLCPDTNALAKSLRLRLCIERHSAAMPFADNCAGDTQITDVVCTYYGKYTNPFDEVICATASGLDGSKVNFVHFCGTTPGHSLACTTGATGACFTDPYAPECSDAAYAATRSSHRVACGEAESANEPAPLCANFRTFLAGCAVASPDTNACGTLVNTYCLADAGRTTGGTVTCDSQIVASCDVNPFNTRCRDAGITNAARYLMERVQACLGSDGYFTTRSLSRIHACNRPEVSNSVCGNPTSPGTDPFNAFCDSSASNPNRASLALTREVFCADSTIANRHAMCPTLRTGASWLADSRNSDDTEKLSILRVSPSQNRGADGNGVARVTHLTSYIDRTITPYSHSFVSTDISNRGGLRLQGLSTSGVFFLRDNDAVGQRPHTPVELVDGVYEIGETTTTLTTDHKLYAGILSTTNVGALLVNNPVTAEWNGQIHLARGYDTPDDLTDVRNNANPSDTTPDGYADDAAGTNILNPITGGVKLNAVRNKITEVFASKKFTLLVSFDAAGGVIAPKNPIDIADGRMLTINGRFNDKGIIYGTTSYGKDGAVSNGSLTGLIGTSGAVGAFISEGDDNPYGIYAGGFVAVPVPTDLEPSVDYGDWTRSFVSSLHPTVASATTDSDSLAFFLSIADGETLDRGALVAAIQGNPSTVLTLKRPGDDMDGVSYVRGNNGRGNHRILGAVGLLPTTNLGAPFAVSTQTAMWTGKYFTNGENVESSPVTFAIDFSAARTITGTGTGTSAPVFDLEFDARGVITGTVVSAGAFTAEARGLIGAEGLVGGFISPTTSHIGGFVACKRNTADTACE